MVEHFYITFGDPSSSFLDIVRNNRQTSATENPTIATVVGVGNDGDEITQS